MNRTEYMHQLAYQLRRLPKGDYDRTMEYFNEYFDDAGSENEQQAIDDLGTPQQAADQIIQDIAKESLEEENAPKTVKRGFSTVWIVTLAIFASPIALPLALSLIMVLFCIVLSAFLVVAAVAISALCMLAASIIGIFGGIFLLFSSFPNGLATIGVSLPCLGIGILLSIATVKLARWTGKSTMKLTQKFIKGGKRHE